VAGHVQTNQFLLPFEHLARVGLRDIRQIGQQIIDGIELHAGNLPEQAELADIRRPVMLRTVVQHAIQQGQQLGARSKGIECADLDHAFQGALLHDAQVDPLAEIGQAGERPARCPLLKDILQRPCPRVLDRPQPVADAAPAIRELLDGEVQVAPVDLRRQDGDAHPAALRREMGNFGGVITPDGQQGGHVLDRVMRLEEGRLAGEFDVVEDRLGGLRIDPVLRPALHEDGLVLQQVFFLLLGDGAAHQVGIAQRVAEQLRSDLHDLFLVDDNAERLLQDRDQLGVLVFHRLFPVQPPVVHGDVLHRPGAKQGDGRDDVFKRLGAHLGQHFAHPGAFHLEHADGLPAPDQIEHLLHHARLLRIGRVRPVGDVLHRVADAVILLDQITRLAHDRQRGQPQEVHLEQPDRFAGLHIELRYQLDRGVFPRAFGRAMQRDVLIQRPVSDNNPGGVGAGVAHDALQAARRVDQFLHLRVGSVELLQLGDGLPWLVAQHIAELGRLGPAGQQPGDAVDVALIHVQGAAHIADGRFGAKRPKGDDRRHFVLAVFVRGVGDHLRPAVVGIVQVDVGHGHPAGIQKTLEDQAVVQRVDAGDAQAVGGHAARPAAAHIPPDIGVAGELAQVPHDQEVRVEPHAVDDLQLVVEALDEARVGGLLPVPPTQPLLAQVTQIGLLVVTLRHREDRQVVAVILQVDVARLGDLERVGQRLRHLGEQPPHLLRRAEVVAGIGHAHPVRLVLQAAGLDAQQDIMGVEVLGIHVVRVIGRHQRHAVVLAVGDQPAVEDAELVDVVLLQLQVKVLRAEDVLVPADQLAQVAVIMAFLDHARDLRRQAAAGRDQAFGVTGEQFLIHPGTVVVAAHLGLAGQLEQVAVAGLVASQQQQVVGLDVQVRVAVVHAAPGQVCFHADHRLDPGLFRRAEELNHAEHRAVIGDRQRRHLHLGGALDQPVDLAQPV